MTPHLLSNLKQLANAHRLHLSPRPPLVDWGDLADGLAPDEFLSVLALDAAPWRAGGNPEERFDLLQEHMRDEIAAAVSILREALADADPSNDWIMIESFAKRVRGSINRHYYTAYQLGREHSNPFWFGFRQEDMDAVRELIESEYAYLRGFTSDLRERVRAGDALTGRLEWRADLYGKSLTRAYQLGCMAGETKDDIIEILPGKPKTDHCRVCPTRWGRYTRREFNDRFGEGTTPADWCEGRSNCHCRTRTIPGRLPTIQEIMRSAAMRRQQEGGL